MLEKNPDEFYFGMMSQKGPSTSGKNRTGTVNGDKGNQVLSQDAVRLFKTQDLGYVRTMRNRAAKEVETLKMQSVGIHGDGRRVVYVDDMDEQVERFEQGQDEDYSDSDSENMEDPEDESAKKATSASVTPADLEAKRLRRLQQKEADKIEGRLAVAQERLEALTQAEKALDLQRAKMNKAPAVGGVNKQGVKFKVRERKR